jgi:hypothetical protein
MIGTKEWCETVMELDDTLQTFDKNDLDRVHSEINSAKTVIEEAKSLLGDYKKKRVELREAAEVLAKGKVKGKGKCKGKAKAPPRYEVPTVIPHSEAKGFLPPGSRIWRNLVRSAWNAKLDPNPRMSESWKVNPDDLALKLILARLWRQYLDMHVLPDLDCPFDGLLSYVV